MSSTHDDFADEYFAIVADALADELDPAEEEPIPAGKTVDEWAAEMGWVLDP